MAEAIIFEVNIQDSLSKLAGLREQLDDIKASQKNLDQAFKEGTIAGDEYRKTTEALKIVTKNVSSEYRSAQRLLEGYTGAQKDNIDTTNFANNSVRQNRLLLKQLTEQYNDAKNPTAAFANQIKTLSDTLKRQESAIGDNRRSVGGYAEGIKQAFGELKIGNVQLSTLQDGLTGAANGFKAAGGGVKGFSAALATTGLPIIILGVQTLFDLLSSFTPLVEAIEDATASLSAAWSAFVNGGSVQEAVKNARELLEVQRDLEDTAKAQEIRNQKAENQIQKLIVQSKDRTKTEEDRIKLIRDANKIEEEIFNENVKRTDKLINAQAKVLQQQLGISQKQLKILAEGNTAEALALRQTLENNGKLTKSRAEDLNNFQELIKQKLKANGDSLILQEKLQNRENQLLEATAQEREKAVQKERQRLEELRKQREAYNANIAKLTDEFNLSEREKLAKGFDDKLAQIKGANDSELALIANINAAKKLALQKFDEDAKKRRQDEQKKFDDELKAIQTKQFNDAIQFNQKQAELDQQAVDLSVASEEEKAARKRDIQLRALEEQLALTREFLGADGEITQAELQGLQAIEQQIQKVRQTAAQPSERTLGEAIGVSPEQQAQINEGLAVISQSVSAIGEVINSAYQVRLNDIEAVKNAEIAAINASGASAEEKTKKVQEAEKKAAMEAYEIQKKQFETNKTIAIIQTVINTAQAVMAQLANPTPYVGIVLAALAAATGAAQIAVIASQKPPAPPAFADGGKVLSGQMIGANDGKPIQRGNGDNLLATVKTGEVILNQRQQAALGGAATFRKIGVPGFAAGGLVGDGGFAARGMTRASEDRSFMTAAIRSGFATAPQPIVTVEEFNKVSSSSQRSVAVSEL